MSEIRSTLKLKKSTVAGETPQPQELQVAELALNVADRKLYSKDHQGTVIELFGQSESDIPYQPVPFVRSKTQVTSPSETFQSASDRTIDLPPTIEEGDLIVAFISTRNENVVTCADPSFESANNGVPYLPSMAPDYPEGPQGISVFTKRATGNETGTVTFDRPNYTAGDNEMMAGFMVCVANTTGITGVAEQYEDGVTCSITGGKFSANTFCIAAYTHVFANDPPTVSSYSATGMTNIYTSGYNSRLSYSTLLTPSVPSTLTHRIDQSSTTYSSNHSAIVVSFGGPEGIDVSAPVKSVQGKVGDVRLNVSEMDDVTLSAAAGDLWDTKVTVTPAANGEFKSDLNTPTFYTVSASGRDATGDLNLLGVGRLFWMSEDRVTWTEYTPVGSPVEDTVTSTVQLTLDKNFIPAGNQIYISLEDPANYELADGDSLIWNADTQLWEAKRPEDAVKRIDDLIDVDTSTYPPNNGEVLEWSGSAWVPGDGSGIVSVTSVNGQSGVVELGIKDMTDYFSEGNALEFFYNDVLANDLVPSGEGQWGKVSDNELLFNDKSFTGVVSVNAGDVINQLSSGDSIWLSETGLTWTEFLLTENPSTLGGVVKVLKIDGAGWPSTQESVYLSLQSPSTIQQLIPEDQALITYDADKAKYVPGQPAVRKLVDFQDIDKSNGIPDQSTLIYDSTRALWEPFQVEAIPTYTFAKSGDDDDDPIFMSGPGLIAPMPALYNNKYASFNPPNTDQQRAPMTVQRGQTYIFDFSAVAFLDPAYIDENYQPMLVRPWILTEEGGNLGVKRSPIQGSQEFEPTDIPYDWNPTTRLLTITIPQSHRWDRYFIALGTNGEWYDSYGIWQLSPPSTASLASTCLGWFGMNLNTAPQDGFSRSTNTTNANGNYFLDPAIVPMRAGTNNPLHGWQGRVFRDNPYGKSTDIGGVPYRYVVHGEDTEFVNLQGRVIININPPDGYDARTDDNSFIIEVFADGFKNPFEDADPSTDFFVYNVVRQSMYELTIDFKNLTGTKLIPDAIKVTMFQNPDPDYRGIEN